MIVVDTHAWYWWLTGEPGLSPNALGRLNREREVVVPAIALWEIAMMAASGRVRLSLDVVDFLNEALTWEGVRIEPVSPEIAGRAANLSRQHRLDPGDQLICATAMHLAVPLVTRDERLHSIPGLRTIW